MTIALSTAFFFSGAAALMFETLWFRLCGMTLGNTVWASSFVLAAFMGGLALGNGIAARVGHRFVRPLRAYAAIECIVAASGLGLLFLLPMLTPLLAPVFARLAGNAITLNATRLSVAYFLMLLPTTAMGMTLPLLTTALALTDERFGRVLGRLYGWNTLGAVLGAIMGETVFIARMGIRGTGVVAALACAIAASIAFRLDSRAPDVVARKADRVRTSAAILRIALLGGAAFLAGGLLLALEVIWFRFLQFFVFGSSTAFAIMLAAVLAGIALGGLAGGFWLGRDDLAFRWSPLVAVLSGFVVASTYWAFTPDSRLPSAARELLTVARLVLPASFFSGLLFTLLGRAIREEYSHETTATGVLTLANTLGAMIGALVAGLFLLPKLGIEASLFALALGYAAVSIASYLGLSEIERRSRRGWVSLAAVPVFAVILAAFPFGLLRNHFVPRALRNFTPPVTYLVAYREGLTETVSYLRTDWMGAPVSFRLVTNGHSMAASRFLDRRYMKLYVYWAVAVNPEIRKALLVSYGLGMTAEALTHTRALDSIDVVDTSREILGLADVVFGGPERGPLSDPRVRVHVDDGRFFLQTTRQRYDLITSEPPPPDGAGIVNLYSREYFELLRQHLNPGGVVTYWLPVHQLRVPHAKAVVAAFCSALDDCALWNPGRGDWMLTGTHGAVTSDSEERFVRQWKDPIVSREVADLGFELPEQLGATFVAGQADLAAWVGPAPAVDDDHPHRLGGRGLPGPDDRREFEAFSNVATARERFAASPFVARVWPPDLRMRSMEFFEYQRYFHGEFPLFDSARFLELVRVLDSSRLRTLPLLLLDSDPSYIAIARAAAAHGKRASDLSYQLGAGALAERDYAEAGRRFTESERLGGKTAWLVLLRALVLVRGGRVDEAQTVLQETPAPASGPLSEARQWLEREISARDVRRASKTPAPRAKRSALEATTSKTRQGTEEPRSSAGTSPTLRFAPAEPRRRAEMREGSSPGC